MNSRNSLNGRAPAAKTLGDVISPVTAPATTEAEWVSLVRSIAGGDQRALLALYERSHRLVFTLAMRITQNRATAEELTVDVFHDIWRRAAGYDPAGGTVIGWIMNQARSRSIDRVRFDQRKKRTPQDTDGTMPAAGPDEWADAKEQARLVRDALSTLTPDERASIETAFFSELTYGEVAARLGHPIGTIKTRIRSGLRKLRQALDPTVKES